MLEVRNLYAGYGSKSVLNNVNFSLQKGEFLALLGPNGAGKSTILRVLSGVLPPLSGKVLVNGIDLSSIPPREKAKIIAVVPQRLEFNFPFSVEKVVAMGRYPHGDKGREIVEWAIKKLDLEGLRERKLSSLSGGEFKRVIIAKALAQSPKILLLDEPLSHLDLKHQLKLLTLLKELSQGGTVVISVFHDINMAFKGPSTVILLKKGRIKALGPPQEVITPALLRETYEVSIKICNGYNIPHVVF